MKAFGGKCLVVLQAGETAGNVVLTASADGLKESIVTVQIKK